MRYKIKPVDGGDDHGAGDDDSTTTSLPRWLFSGISVGAIENREGNMEL